MAGIKNSGLLRGRLNGLVSGSLVKKKFLLVMRFVMLGLSIFLLLAVFSCSPGRELKSSGSHEEESGYLTGSNETEEKDSFNKKNDLNDNDKNNNNGNNDEQDSPLFKMLCRMVHCIVEGLPEYF